MRWQASLLLVPAVCVAELCPVKREKPPETQTVSFFQHTITRKIDVQARGARRKMEPGEPRGLAGAAGHPRPTPTPLQSIASVGASEHADRANVSVADANAYGDKPAGVVDWPTIHAAFGRIFSREANPFGGYGSPPFWRDLSPKFPEGSDIWNVSLGWVNVTLRHPTGVVSNLASKKVVWADVNYVSLDSLYIVSLVAYPAVFIFILLALTVFTGVCMAWMNGSEQPGEEAVSDEPDDKDAEDLGNDTTLGPSLALNSEGLSAGARRLFAWWSLFCRTIPASMVFGTPSLLIALSYPYPQEVFMLLVVVSSVLVFSNGLYMVFFCPFMLVKMRQAMTGYDLGMPSELSLGSTGARLEDRLVHWVILPNYKESVETLSGSLESIAQSPIAAKQIGVLLAMEEREHDIDSKVALLKAKFAGCFREVASVAHPADLPSDPPGKASNVAWAFRWLSRHLGKTGQDLSLVVLTVADADSEFHRLYFQGLGRQFVETAPARRSAKLWQAPVFHVKNYHRQPMLLIVSTMFTAMSEVAVLSDPNSIRFPYSTYSLSFELARRVGGWDPDWIAEDWHMGIKCFLLTLGESEVESVLLPTVNYMPEVSGSWLGTIAARWSQAKRHALGFSDMSYYFMMLPLLFCRLSLLQGKGHGGPNLQDFWRTFFYGIAYIIRLVNTHVVVGILTLYMIISFLLKSVMYVELQDLRHIGQLFDRATAACGSFFAASLISIAITTLSFQVVYASLRDRMEPATRAWRHIFAWPILHWAYTFVAGLVFAAVYCSGLAAAVWIAAVKVLFGGSFEYEVAAKPTKDAKEASH